MGNITIMERATDMEVPLFYMTHIEHPCREPITGLTIRDVYLREAKKALKTFENPYAKSLLERRIEEYS